MDPRLLASVLPAGVVVEETSLAGPFDPLHPAEAQCVARAVTKRRVEFTAGRHCARKALTRLGFGDAPLLPGCHRAPRWPRGVVGSISHTGNPPSGWCAAAVARRPPFASVGVDAEMSRPLPTALWRHVLRPREQDAIERAPADVRAVAATLFFSAKESVFKCQYPLSGTFLDFHDVRVEIDWRTACFDAVFERPIPRLHAGDRLQGRFRIDSGLLVTAVVLLEADLRPGVAAVATQEDLPCAP